MEASYHVLLRPFSKIWSKVHFNAISRYIPRVGHCYRVGIRNMDNLNLVVEVVG